MSAPGTFSTIVEISTLPGQIRLADVKLRCGVAIAETELESSRVILNKTKKIGNLEIKMAESIMPSEHEIKLASLKRQLDTLVETKKSLKAAGVETDALNEAISKISSQISALVVQTYA